MPNSPNPPSRASHLFLPIITSNWRLVRAMPLGPPTKTHLFTTFFPEIPRTAAHITRLSGLRFPLVRRRNRPFRKRQTAVNAQTQAGALPRLQELLREKLLLFSDMKDGFWE